MKFDNIPEKGIFPGYEDPKVTQRKFAAMKAIMEGKLDFIPAEHKPTPGDFQGLNPDSTEEDFLKWIERETGIKPEIILEDGNSRESAQRYRFLNYAYQEARNFLKNTLKYPPEELFKDIEVKSISSKKDIFDLLKRVRLTSNKEGLSQSMKYCRIVKATIAAYETLKNDSKLLKKITEDFEKSLISSPLEDGIAADTPLVFSGEYNENGRGFSAAENTKIEGSLDSRAKGLDSIILKFLSRPESNAKVALKDGVASRITIQKSEAIKLLPIIYEWLTEKMGATNIKIENKSFFSKQQMNKYFNNFKILGADKSNTSSGGKFEALVITGKLHNSSHGGQFEIQFVDPDNKNEEGGMHHDIYDVVKLVTVVTRLDGACRQSMFEKYILDAHDKSGISMKELKYHLVEKTGAPIIKKRKKNGKYIYIADAVYKRWNEFNWVDESLYSEIKDARK